ncbi:hypothetical protein BGZ61DRAFT_540437 [Ilyonectria robusta]|uniref:uncharacterized protein n=1 Tax=Ilyonectria robusta TaxID=1079257 RepID=UPI001E8CB5A9|nr:uncharacterized protein BGZ61DRAFT_540437 [Ilyonectria robusta]KAH8658929.1 hypothetical protein BGZ61DRAFT_540437 [Ilyonectria robusta]
MNINPDATELQCLNQHNPLANASQLAPRASAEPAKAAIFVPANDIEKEAYEAVAGIIPSNLLERVWTTVQIFADARETCTRAATATSTATSTAEERMTAKTTEAGTTAVATPLAAAPAAASDTSRPSYASIAARNLTPTPTGSSQRSTRRRIEREVAVRTRNGAPRYKEQNPNGRRSGCE